MYASVTPGSNGVESSIGYRTALWPLSYASSAFWGVMLPAKEQQGLTCRS